MRGEGNRPAEQAEEVAVAAAADVLRHAHVFAFCCCYTLTRSPLVVVMRFFLLLLFECALDKGMHIALINYADQVRLDRSHAFAPVIADLWGRFSLTLSVSN